MIISRTPTRISFFGGGTDYPVWYLENGGMVLSTSINKYSYITVRYLPKIFDYKFRIRYFKTEEVQSLNEIKHPSVRECARSLGIVDGFEVIHHADLPAGTGLGSSSTFTVGMLHSFYSVCWLSIAGFPGMKEMDVSLVIGKKAVHALRRKGTAS